MPSKSDPKTSVNSGPGKLSTGVVPSSALLFPSGGGSGAALQAHILNPHDAHMAHAIGIDPFYPYPSGTSPLLTSVGGVIDGESVLDFINEFKDLIPPRPNSIGFNLATGVSSAIPAWGLLDASGVGSGTSLTGGYQNGTNVSFSHFLVPNGSTAFSLSGLLFPADRGVIAFYKNTDGNFFNSGTTTLVAALSLNDTAPAGIPNAAFSETLRQGQQANYTATNAGIDFFSLTYRLPYLTSYAAYPGTPYGPFSINFYRYQLAMYALASQAVGAGNAQSFLLVHWRETFATSLSAIQPTNLTLANLTATNCYSAVPSGGNFDDNTAAVYNVNRHYVFRDTNSAVAPSGNTFTSAQNGTPTTVPLSGVQFYSNGATPLHWTIDIRANSLFANSFLTGSSDSPPNVPSQFHSAFDPMQIDFGGFGGGLLLVPYYSMNKFGGAAYSNTNSPAAADVGQYTNAALAIASPSPASPTGGYGQLKANLRTPFQETVYTDTIQYLFNSYDQTGAGISTSTYEPFVDEHYRYSLSFDPTTTATVPIVPAGGNIFPSSTALTVTGSDLQEVGNLLVYPQVNYGAASFRPTLQPDYSGFPAGDGLNHLRRYMRAFDTGLPRNTGKLRIRGLAYSAFQALAAYNGTETTGHTGAYPNGGAIIQIMVPGGGTGWLDLGRAYGDPGIATLNYYGCSTAVTTSGSDVFVTYNTTSFTSNNGSGQYLLFVRVTLINEASANSLTIDEIEWQAP